MNLNHSRSWGLFCVIMGAALFSVKGVVSKLAYQTGIDATTLLALRMSFALLMYLPIVYFSFPKKDTFVIQKNHWMQIGFLGFIGYYLSSWLDFKGLEFVSAGLERMIIFTYPIFVILLTAISTKKWPSPLIWFCMISSYLGIMTFYWGDPNLDPEHGHFGILLILLSAFFFAIFLIVGGKLIPKLGSTFYTASTMSVAGFCILTHYMILRPHPYQNIPFMAYVWGLTIAVFCTVIPTLFMNRGIQILGASTSSLLATTGPISTLFVGYFVLSETITPLKIVGLILILIAGLVISQQKEKS